MEDEYDFTETLDSISLVFYVVPNATEDADAELLDSKTLLYNKKKIDLFAPTHCLAVSRTASKIELTLSKERPGKWYSVGGGIIPLRNCNDKLGELIEEQPQSMFDLLSGIYSKGNYEVRKAMIKSIVESEGTVLSTDWDSVSKKKVEREK